MSAPTDSGTILVAPHHFPDLDRERALAAEFALELVEAPDVAAFRAALPDAGIVLLTPYARLGEEELARLVRCRAVVRYGIGYDNIDVPAAERAGIPVAIVPGTANEEVASHAFAMGLALARRIPAGQAAIAAGGWAGTIAYDAPPLSRLEVAVIGMGRIGRRVAGMWAAVGATVRAYDPFATFDEVPAAPLAELLEASDVVSLHVPLGEATRGLVSADVIARMRRGAVVVNVSRGGLVDEAALAAALASGHLGGAGIDTFADEPLPADHPLRGAQSAILTPHVAWRSNVSLGALQAGAVARVRAALVGATMDDLVTRA